VNILTILLSHILMRHSFSITANGLRLTEVRDLTALNLI
jgi:hypothetical protein